MLLRSAARLAAVVVVAGTVGSLLGIVIAALTGDDDTPSSAPVVAPTSPTPAAAAEQLRVDIASTSVRPATVDAVESAIVRVDVRVENATGRAVRPEPPRLLVDDIRVAPEPGPNSTGALLAPLLDEGAAADGTLRFDLRSRTAEEVIAARVRLRIAGKVIVLEPVLAEPAAAG
ncbi:MAG: hypothetical protein Q8K79_04155 [Solirubrobacteraceae bacterium]|nr:hypothetical protein [Solirubrobacteraceae bacterium]